MAIAMNIYYRDGNIHCMDTPGSRLKALRKKKGLSQVQLSALVGIDQSTISDIENGGGLSAEYMMRLCEALDTTPQYVMRGRPAVDEVIEQIRALVTPSVVSGNSDRVLQHESKDQHHNQKQAQEKKPLVFGPALTAAFSFGRDVKNGDSDKSSRAPKKRRGSNS